MFELQGLINGFSLALTPVNLLFGFIGAVLGTAVLSDLLGALPLMLGTGVGAELRHPLGSG